MRSETDRLDLVREVEELHKSLRMPGSGLISEASEVSVHNGCAAYSGSIVEKLDGLPLTRICLTDLRSADLRVITNGPNNDRHPKFSPDGTQLAFLSDRAEHGVFQLFLINLITGVEKAAPEIEGSIEYLHWSHSGDKILLGVAGRGAAVAGAQGATLSADRNPVPDWVPEVHSRRTNAGRRRAWIFDLAKEEVDPVGPISENIWESGWCGTDHLVAIASPGNDESDWYKSRLLQIDLLSNQHRELYVPNAQIGWPSASPTGDKIAFVEAISSDRWIVAGELRLISLDAGSTIAADTGGMDVSCVEWISEDRILIAGHRGLESVVSKLEVNTSSLSEVWSSFDITSCGFHLTVAAADSNGAFAMVGEGFERSPELALVEDGRYTSIRSFDLGYRDYSCAIAQVDQIAWLAPDGLEIQGWLLRPAADGPYPLVMNIHGGPVWHSRPSWLGRSPSVLMLLKKGIAVFFPNARGSSGRGQDFARAIVGEMGGKDTNDFLSGLDHIVAAGIADPERIGVTGGSYGDT